MNNRQLTFAREYRGYSQTELADSISGLSQSNLSKFEKGFGVLSNDVQLKIIKFLDFPVEFFEKKINITIENANYRKKSSISKSITQMFDNKCKLIGYSIDELSESIEWPDFSLTQLNPDDGYSPEYVAEYNRRLLNLTPDEPVKDIFQLLESKGIIIYEIDDHEKFDGVSFITEKGFPIIIVNKKFSNDRKRFTIAHELGHLLLHNGFPISDYRDKELEANKFASEFLMPEENIYRSLRNLRMNNLSELKRYWLTSMSSIIRRARDLKCIDNDRYRFFMIEMSRCGYSRSEPINVYIDSPRSIRQACNLLKERLEYTIDDFSKFLSLPKDIIEDLFFNDKVRLRIV